MIQTIRHQDSGALVRAAKLLTGYSIDDTEVFTAEFTSCVISWQKEHGLTADGVIGPKTWTALSGVQPTVSANRNRECAAVKALQLILDGNLTPDGIFGPRTKAAVTAFQAAKGLETDGICGAKTWRAVITGEGAVTATASGNFRQPVDYKQGDSRWGSKMYSNHGDSGQTMRNSGCGPTAAADIIATLKDSSITPYDLAVLSMDWGTRTYSSGTSWDFFSNLAKHYCFSKFIQTASLEILKACLDAGGYAVCSMAPGYWTKGGHFICAWKYDEKYIYCNDPASSSRKSQNVRDFMKERKQFFCFFPDEKRRNGKEIVDISKWDGKIDFHALGNEVAFVIARASVGSDKDPKFDEYAEEMIKNDIPFGVYGYSYARTPEKAVDEAEKLYEYASKYKPLFFVMDAEEDGITDEMIALYSDSLRSLGAAKVGCYVAHHKYKSYKFESIRDRFDFIWIPRYGTKKPDYICDLWQFTETGKIAGINGDVDLNVVTGDGHHLDWFLKGCETDA